MGKALIVWGTDTALVWLKAVSNAGWWWLGASLTARDEREAHCQPIAGGCRDRGSQLVGVVRGDADVVSGRLNKRCVFWCCFNGRGLAVGSSVCGCGGGFALVPVVADASTRRVEVGLELGVQVCLCVKSAML